jgi:hypothetical protein
MKRLLFSLLVVELLLSSGCSTSRVQPDIALAQKKLGLTSDESWKQVHFLPPAFSDFQRLHSEGRVLVFQSHSNAAVYRLYYPIEYEKGGGSAHYEERGWADDVLRVGSIGLVECFVPTHE